MAQVESWSRRSISPLRSLGWPSSKRQIMKVSEVDWLELKICLSTLFFGTSGRRCSWSPFRRSTGNDVSGHYFHHYFFPLFFSPSSPFLIEGVLGSKNLFSESDSKCQTPSDIFWSPGAHFGFCRGF